MRKYNSMKFKMKIMIKKNRNVNIFLLLFLSKIPYLIYFYPGLIIYDSGSSIAQFYGYRTFAASLSSTPQYFLTDQHMSIFTLWMGGFVKLGEMMGDQNFGFFLYIIVQVIISNIILVNCLDLLKKAVNNKAIFIIVLLFFAIMPHISMWQITMAKDTYYSVFTLLFCSCICRLIVSKFEALNYRSFIVVFFLSGLFSCLCKHQGSPIMFVTGIFLLLIYKKGALRVFLLTLSIFIICSPIYTNLVLPAFNISKPGMQIKISFMLQQTARYVIEHENEITDKEYKAIDAVIPYDKIQELYDPKRQDPIMFAYKQNAQTEEINNYIKVWLKMLFKHPVTYIRASLDIYEDYYINLFDDSIFTSPTRLQGNPILNQYKFNLANCQAYEKMEHTRKRIIGLTLHSPLNIFFGMPCILISFIVGNILLLMTKKYHMLIAEFPLCLVFLVLIISPSVSFRYILPLAYSIPFIYALIFDHIVSIPKKDRIL